MNQILPRGRKYDTHLLISNFGGFFKVAQTFDDDICEKFIVKQGF